MEMANAIAKLTSDNFMQFSLFLLLYHTHTHWALSLVRPCSYVFSLCRATPKCERADVVRLSTNRMEYCYGKCIDDVRLAAAGAQQQAVSLCKQHSEHSNRRYSVEITNSIYFQAKTMASLTALCACNAIGTQSGTVEHTLE